MVHRTARLVLFPRFFSLRSFSNSERTDSTRTTFPAHCKMHLPQHDSSKLSSGPFDSHHNGYNTKMTCKREGMYSDCSCKFQGSAISTSIYTDYPFDDPGKYKTKLGISHYGTSCAAWDRVPQTPWYSSCETSTAAKDFGTLANNWCTSPWCYTHESCTFGSGSDVFKGSSAAWFSYEACGLNNCYADTLYEEERSRGGPRHVVLVTSTLSCHGTTSTLSSMFNVVLCSCCVFEIHK